tara:strand:+ start:151 stop:336 length:186 start_codon:yes stop_codon:yes gene_type:complete
MGFHRCSKSVGIACWSPGHLIFQTADSKKKTFSKHIPPGDFGVKQHFWSPVPCHPPPATRV